MEGLHRDSIGRVEKWKVVFNKKSRLWRGRSGGRGGGNRASQSLLDNLIWGEDFNLMLRF